MPSLFVADSISTALVERAKTDSERVLAEIAAFEITSDAEAESVALRLREVDAQEDAITAAQKKIIDPLNDGIAEARKFFKPGLEACAILKRAMKNVLNAWGEKVRERAAALRKLQEAERAKALAEKAKPTVEAVANVQTATANAASARADAIAATGSVRPELAKTTVNASTRGAAKTRGDWKHAIVNADLVPRRFLVVDETAVRRWISEQKKLGKLKVVNDEPVAEVSIPGVKLEYVYDTVL